MFRAATESQAERDIALGSQCTTGRMLSLPYTRGKVIVAETILNGGIPTAQICGAILGTKASALVVCNSPVRTIDHGHCSRMRHGSSVNNYESAELSSPVM